jgi:hypothetical protein
MESQAVGRIEPDDAAFRSTARPSLLARVGIDLRARDRAIVTIVDGRTGDVTVRRDVRRDGTPAVLREELAHVVQAAIDPMVVAERDRANAAAAPAVEPPAAEPPAPPAPAPAPSSPPEAPRPEAPRALPSGRSIAPLALDVAVTAGVGSFADGAAVVPRAGGAVALVVARGLRPSVGLSAAYLFPFEAGSEVTLAHVDATLLRATAGIELVRAGAFAVDLGLGGGLDLLGVEPRSNVLPASRLGSPTRRADPVVAGGATGYLSIGAGTSLSLLLGADVDLASRHWVLESDSGVQTEAFSPSRVRPVATLGLSFTPLGDARFAALEPPR